MRGDSWTYHARCAVGEEAKRLSRKVVVLKIYGELDKPLTAVMEVPVKVREWLSITVPSLHLPRWHMDT